MTLDLKIDQDMKAVDRHLFRTETRTIKKAASAAINQTLSNVKTAGNKELRKTWKITNKEINKIYQIKRANWGNLNAYIRAVPFAPNLIRYKARMTKQGLKANPRGKAQLYKGAFIANKGRTVFTRRTKKRLPIIPVHGPNLPTEFAKEAVKKAMDTRGAEQWPKNFKRQLERRLK